MPVGIEAINVYAARASLDVRQLFDARGLDLQRFGNLMMGQKSVNLPCEDPVTNGVNAARPLIAALTPSQRNQIELLIVGTESGLDYAKPISTYIHEYLGLNRRCRSFEIKHACYGGTAALQMAASFVAASPVPGMKALVIAAEAASTADRGSYWEPSQGAGAVGMLVSAQPDILALDPGASGYYTYEVMDTLRPRPDLEAGDTDLSLMSYLECLHRTYEMYCERVSGADIIATFDYLVFHAPFSGMVKGAHRTLLRKQRGMPPDVVERDFETRMAPSLIYCSRIGNLYSGSLYAALCSLIEHVELDGARRIGMYSYGSGCASEFYSGVLQDRARDKLAVLQIGAALDARQPLTMGEYELVSDLSIERMGGAKDMVFDTSRYRAAYDACLAGRELLVLDRITNFHRVYRWS
ncbi:MAG: hydroxymethylglutaryl-CoA synthase family protein [Deltaproteobacteria bacterium]|nr:MAG: hydroxymethylglutaryl-CoA synthase family protein [Deltaproteobacteria bacterium]